MAPQKVFDCVRDLNSSMSVLLWLVNAWPGLRSSQSGGGGSICEAVPGCRHSASKTRVNVLEAHPGYGLATGPHAMTHPFSPHADAVAAGAANATPESICMSAARSAMPPIWVSVTGGSHTQPEGYF